MQAGDQIPLVLIRSNREAIGLIEFVSPITDPDSRTVRVEVVIDNSLRQYRAGVPVRIGSFDQARQMLFNRQSSRFTPK